MKTRTIGLLSTLLGISIVVSFVIWRTGAAMVGDYEWEELPRFIGHHLAALCAIVLLLPTAAIALVFISESDRRTQVGAVMLATLCVVLGFANARYLALARSPEAAENGEFDDSFNRSRYLTPLPHWAIDETDRAHRSLKFMPGMAEQVAVDALVGSTSGIVLSLKDHAYGSTPIRILAAFETVFIAGLVLLVIRLLIPGSSAPRVDDLGARPA